MQLATSDGIELFYFTKGDKSAIPVVLVHGLGADHQMWAPQLTSYPNEGFYVLAPDMRGHGQSPNVDAFSFNDCARDIFELIHHQDLDKVNLVGVSMGGLIVQRFACDFPQHVAKLVVADSFSEVTTFKQKMAGWMQWLTIKIAPGLLSKSLAQAYKGPDKEAALRYFRESYAKTDKSQLLKARAAINRFNITHRLESLHIPTLVLVGDGFGKFAVSMAKKTAETIPNAQFKVLRGGCDPSNLIVPRAFDQEVLTFLKGD
jgi:3-oxoadipate enol-lactonase